MRQRSEDLNRLDKDFRRLIRTGKGTRLYYRKRRVEKSPGVKIKSLQRDREGIERGVNIQSRKNKH